ncbi:MAG: amino acid adenylation domain-containing protein [Isosphaeraceae bacterium]
MNSATRSPIARSPEMVLSRQPEEMMRRSRAKLRCVHRWIEIQAARTPDAIALTCAGEPLTYAELNARANRLGRHLRSLGVGPEVLVGLCVRRSSAMVMGLLAVLKAGGAYVPLDPTYPAERLGFMLSDARPSVLLTEQELLERLPASSAQVVCLDRDWATIADEPDGNLPGGAGLHNLAYVIYTSGSTGRPKGAMIHHLGLANYLGWCTRAYAVHEGQGAPVHSSISFDLTITALLAPLVAGLRVDLLDEDLGVEQLGEALRHSRDYSLVKITPAHLRWLGDQLNPRDAGGRTRAFVIGGEALTPEHVAFWRRHAPETVLINEYGPTETVVGCCVYRVPRDQPISGSIPIGRPIANTRLYVLNEDLEPVPVGVAGELYIGGVGVARGYLRRPALTAERFIPDPFALEPGRRLYRTGDLARWRSDGNLEYLGRVDRQVKVRGFRIEPAEIEEALVRHPSVREAVVVTCEHGPDDRRLAAYVTLAEGRTAPDDAELRRFLRSWLTEPMIPSAFMVLQSFPLTPNGKIDREALPDTRSGPTRPDASFVAPRGPVEEEVASAWKAVLRLERVSVHDNFFDLGGHSLLATQVVSRLRNAAGVEIPLRALFDAPTVAGLAERVEAVRRGAARREVARIEPAARVSPLSLSFSQEALWFLDQLAPGQPTFNVTAAVRIAGPLDLGALQRSLDELVRRHESLRTTFVAIGGTPHQVIARSLRIALELVDLTTLRPGDREAEARRRAIDDSRRPFDLDRGPLIRVSLLRLGEGENVALLTMHHLITDGWSFGVAAGELAALYEADRQGLPSPLPEPPIQYADFALWQREQLRSGAWSIAIDCWKRRLSGVPPLELPADRPRPPIRSPRGAMIPLAISPDLSESVRALCRREGVTPFMTLLAAFQVLLGRWSGQDDFAVGSPVANRTRPESEPLIGYFVNMLAIRADLSGDPTGREFLARVRETALEAFQHQEIPLEVLIPALGPNRDAGRSPLFQVMFVLQNNAMPDAVPTELTLSPFDSDQGTGTAKFDLALGFADSPDGFLGSIEFNTDLFEASTIERFARHYRKLLEGLVAHPECPLSALSLLSSQERQQVTEWSRMPSASPDLSEFLDRPERSGIHGRFETQADASPDALALIAGQERLTYAELNCRANRLAHYLRSRGVGPEVRVGLLLDDPIHRIVAVLGVLKAGGAYVPLESSMPRARLADMLDAARVPIVIVEQGTHRRAPQTSAMTIELDAESVAIAAESPANPVVVCDENLAYVVFTSGTTGRPKGVLVSHRGLMAIASAWEDAYDLRRPPLRHLQAAGFAFDVYTGDWVRALTTGGTLIACPPQVLLDPPALAGLIRRERVECLELVPALAEPLAAHLERTGGDLAGLRLLAVGSDTLHGGLYRRLRSLVGRAGRVLNSYGLTETSIDSSYFEGPLIASREDGPVPIGWPLPGVRAYVLDGRGELVPEGVVGELFIGGSGVARGYVESPGQTAERFLPDPQGRPGSRMYATGDRARWRDGGVLELLGRRDGQVKVRGFRIELAEVEAAIGSCPGVREAAVIAREDGADGHRLIAYILGDGAQTPRVETIRRFLRVRLPRPMIPSQFRVVEAMPRTHSGKVDRRSLAESLPDAAPMARDVVLPRDEMERQLAAIWEDLLPIRPIGVTDDFFDLGGHSLLAVRLAARIEEQFGRSPALSDLLLGATIEDLAARLREPIGSKRRSLLVDLGATGPGRPLVLVHPIGGGILCYNALARSFDGARPVLGLQAAGLDDEEQPETDLVRMASRYIEALLEERPDGPYFLGGWSMGGIVALEMAAQLVAAGHEVPMVVLIDCSVPAPERVPHAFDERESLTAFAADLVRASGRETRATIEDLLARHPDSIRNGTIDPSVLGHELTREIGPERLRRLHDVFRANRLAMDGYRPRTYSGRVVLIRAGSGRYDLKGDQKRGWKSLLPGGVTTYPLAGDHYTIMQPPAVERLAEIVSMEIDRLEKTTEGVDPR